MYESFTDTTNAQCLSTGSATTNFTTSLSTYLEQCRNGGQYPEAVTNFFNQTMNIPSQFETMSVVYTDLNATLTNIISNNGALSFVEKIDNALDTINEKESELKGLKKKLEKDAERNDRRFVEEKIVATDSSDSFRTFQDKVISALFISYIFLAITVISITARNSQYNYKVIAVSALIFLFISSVLFALFKHFA